LLSSSAACGCARRWTRGRAPERVEESFMSTDKSELTRGLPAMLIAWWAAGGIAVVFVVVLLILGRSSSNMGSTAPTARPEDSQEAARQLLIKDSDLGTCHSAINNLNTYFTQAPQKRPAVLSAAEAAALRQQAGLTADEAEEITGSN